MPSFRRSRSALRPPSSSRERPAKLMKSNPVSRNTSPAPLRRRGSKLDEYLAKSSRRNSTSTLTATADIVPTFLSAKEMKRWDGVQRMTERWDFVRRDPELWLPNGDCLVHFYERGGSKRGASLRIYLADRSHSRELRALPESKRATRDSGYFDEPSPYAQHDLYLAAPSHYSREEALQYHVITRNFFAWMYEKPLVGERLGQGLINLQERMHVYRPISNENQDDLLKYVEDQGYMDFRHCPDHALALLQYAEKYELDDLWTDAFVHCSGMNDELEISGELEKVSRTSQNLITRAHIEMDIRLERAGRSLTSFLEEDLSDALGKEAYLQLERFRSFLYSFYVGRYSFWPPAAGITSSGILPKSVYSSMYLDFRNLYGYLADTESRASLRDEQYVIDCSSISDLLSEFDRKHKLDQLPYLLPLIPKLPEQVNRRRSIFNILGWGRARQERRVAAFSALKAATNHNDSQVMNSNIVREYLRFERDWAMIESPAVSCADGRRARFVLIYAMLQMLISIARVPSEVRETEGVSYPLCCQTAGTPPWANKKVEVPSSSRPPLSRNRTSQLSIQTSCLKPGPLRVSRNSSVTPSRPQRTSFARNIPLRAPVPLRSSSIEVLDHFAEPETASPRPFSFATVTPSRSTPSLRAVSRTLPQDINTTIAPEHTSDPSTPSSTDMSGSGGWSASSSEADMEHQSVAGTDSNYGDDEHEDRNKSTLKVPRGSSLKAPRRTNSASSLKQVNPEVEQFLSA
ncbi:uncharacterized protein KY384_008493 [Bacidia gigantensis]|uniref:uncharacterized protein n=1 Tax=Bacidia gigantensis TaxID=2732470 RepID=UPI001D0510C5|nr:uncharacterized protein KY384_008493 [Bacidia gigantensis]KAG8527064.1 hypothetical protein KY384_008493 [Bacidia gigantensis]